MDANINGFTVGQMSCVTLNFSGVSEGLYRKPGERLDLFSIPHSYVGECRSKAPLRNKGINLVFL